MSTILDDIRAQRDQARSAALALAESDEFNPEDKAFLDLQTRADELDARAVTIATQLQKIADSEAFDGRHSKLVSRREQEQSQTPQTRETWGEAFIRSEVFTQYNGRGTSSRFVLDGVETRALPTGLADLIAAGLTQGKTTVDVTPPVAPTPLLDNMSSVAVSTNAIEFVGFYKVAGGAAKVAEKAAKPSAEFGPQVTSATLDNIAVYTQLTRQMVEDLPAVRSIIDGQLRADVAKKEESEAAAALAAASAVIPDVSNADLLAAIRMGIGTVQAAGYQPNAVVLNPADWAALDIGVMGGTLGGPTMNANFWGLTPIASPSQTAGTAVVGDLRTALTHYYRSQISLYITDSHADTFLANVFTLLAERRSKTVVVRPTALVEAKKVP